LICLPLIVYRFHVASPIAIFLNPLLWAPIALALVTGFGVLLFGDLFPPFAHACGWLCGVSLEWSQRGIFGSRGIAMGYCWMPGPSLWLIAMFYCGIFVWSAYPQVRPRRSIALGLLIGWFFLWFLQLSLQQLALRHDPNLRITFFSVGHGTCVLVELPHGKAFLYDAGRMGSPYSLAGSVANEVWSRGRFGIDAVVISHADVDHFNAVGPIVERIRVQRVFAAPHVIRSRSTLLSALRSALKEQDVKIEQLDAGRGFPLHSAARCSILHPPAAEVPGNDNDNSVVILIEFDGRRVLLPGDLESAGLARLLARPSLDCDVVMAPHHGSARSSPAAMAAWSSPSWIILSDKERPGSHWSAVAERYRVNILDTYSHQAIRCEVTGGKFRWTCWDGRRWGTSNDRK
jgi:competence protein ComEC